MIWGSKNTSVKNLFRRKFIIFIKCNQALIKCLKKFCYICPTFCLLRSEFLVMRLTFDWTSEINSIDRGRDIFRQHWNHSLVFISQDSIKFLDGLIMHSCSKSLPHSSRWITGLSLSKLLSFCYFFFLPFWGVLIKIMHLIIQI